MKGITAKKVLY